MSVHAKSIMKCTQETGGGQSRCVNYFLELNIIKVTIITDLTQITSAWCYCDTTHYSLRQDSTHPLPWEGCIPSLSRYWQYTKGNTSKTYQTRSTVDWVHPSYEASGTC